MRALRIALPALVGAVAVVAAATPSGAAIPRISRSSAARFFSSGPSFGSHAYVDYGTVTKIADGDTIYVDIPGDGKPGVPIRNADIQATEMHGADGLPECWAPDATAMMTRLVPPGTKVRLVVRDRSLTAGTDGAGATRLLRYVDGYDSATGLYDVDVQLALIASGLALWGPGDDNTRVTAYHRVADEAIAHHLGMFGDSRHCGDGPAQDATLQMWTHYDANGDDAVNNGEWIHIRNTGGTAVPIADWKLRDPSHSFYQGGTYYTFPPGAVIPAHGTVTVYAGTGTDDPTTGRFYLQHSTGNVFPNVADYPNVGYPGKTVYLLDPQLDFRAWADYPCLAGCSGPPLQISHVQYKTSNEYIDVRLAPGTTAPADLSGVEVTNDGWTKEIDPGTVLNPGETLRIYCDGPGTDSRLVQYLGHTGGTMLEDTGDTVFVRTDQAVVLDRYSWGTG